MTARRSSSHTAHLATLYTPLFICNHAVSSIPGAWWNALLTLLMTNWVSQLSQLSFWKGVHKTETTKSLFLAFHLHKSVSVFTFMVNRDKDNLLQRSHDLAVEFCSKNTPMSCVYSIWTSPEPALGEKTMAHLQQKLRGWKCCSAMWRDGDWIPMDQLVKEILRGFMGLYHSWLMQSCSQSDNGSAKLL